MTEFETGHPVGLRLRLHQAPNTVRRVLRHPTWLTETIRSQVRRRRGNRRDFSLARHRKAFRSEPDGVAFVTHRSTAEYTTAIAEFPDWISQLDRSLPLFAARPELVRIAYGIVRLLEPRA